MDKGLQNKPCYSLDSHLSGGLHYPPFKQPGPVDRPNKDTEAS